MARRPDMFALAVLFAGAVLLAGCLASGPAEAEGVLLPGEDRKAFESAGREIDLVLLTSRDPAATWTMQRVPTDADERRDETMARLFIEPSGALSVLYPSRGKVERHTPSDMHLARSLDGGLTWTTARVSSGFHPHPDPGDYYDLDVLADGRIIAVWEDARDGTRSPWMAEVGTSRWQRP